MSHSATPLRYQLTSLQILCASILLSACYHPPVLDAGFPQQEIVELPLILPATGDDTLYGGLHNRSAVLAFYAERNFRPVWTDQEPLADTLLNLLGNARYFGLLPEKYHTMEFNAATAPAWRPEVRLRKDVMLTDAFLSIGHDLRYGRLHASTRETDSLMMTSLKIVLTYGRLYQELMKLQPDFAQYHSLQKGLAHTIQTADSLERAWLLQGMTVDSLEAHAKVRTIEVNMERWRSETSAWGDRYIFVNIPSFTVEVFDGGKRIIDSKAIVGKPDKMTPEFSSMVQCFVTYPYWNVPRKISVEEFLPVIQRDTSFIRKNNFDVLSRKGKLLNPDSVEWQKFNENNFPVILRQREGPENSLGVIKFQFDNPYAVFVHDTNAPRLFRNKVRAFSHGCIRMEKATTLGHYLLTGDPRKKSPLLANYLAQKLRHTVDLPHPIPIHIRYFTAVADDTGKVVVHDDIYGKDVELIERLYTSRPAITRAVKNTPSLH